MDESEFWLLPKVPPAARFPDCRLQMNGLQFLRLLPEKSVAAAFLDPQYRGVLDKLAYGNEGKNRGQQRAALQQMNDETIRLFIDGIGRVLKPSGHLFLWMDKFHLCEGFRDWHLNAPLEVVDLISWDKGRIGMGYRTRRTTEYCVVLQKEPRRAKGVWTIHNIPDTWREKIEGRTHTHQKPVGLQSALIAAVTNEGDYVIDPAAGSFSVMQAAIEIKRIFLGCDLNE
ncbi:MAG: DNA methyltransferase [Candidatus Poribacteria bacterium]|nr:DNA methyltransferase [Candidatus Poribacteria bacterium]